MALPFLFDFSWLDQENEEDNAVLASQQQAQLSQHHAELLRKDAIIASKDAEIATIQATKQAEIATKQAEIATKQADIDNLQAQFVQLQARYNRLQRENTLLRHHIEQPQPVTPSAALNQTQFAEADSSITEERVGRRSQTASPLECAPSFTTVEGLESSTLSIRDECQGLFFC